MIIYVRNSDPNVVQGTVTVLGYAQPLMRVSQDELRAVAAVPMDIQAGRYPVKIELAGGVENAQLRVKDRAFEFSELKVSKRFTAKKSAKLKARLRREAAQMKALWSKDATQPKVFGALARPVKGRKTGSFGTRRIFNGKRKSVHYGLDLDGGIGAPIRAVADGVVVMSTMRWTSGGTIIVDHGGGLFTLYFHMSKRYKRPGQKVLTGQLLGLVGKTGRVTGPHLHLAVAIRSVYADRPEQARAMYVDPERFLKLRFQGDPKFKPPMASSLSSKSLFGGRR